MYSILYSTGIYLLKVHYFMEKTNMQNRSILEMSNIDAKQFLLKNQSYCSITLPPYFEFSNLLAEVDVILQENEFQALVNINRIRDDNINYIFFQNKNSKYDWRPISLIHPVVYVHMVNKITELKNWNHITDRFRELEKKKDKTIECLSIPVESKTEQSDKAAQVSHWWRSVEQKSIELSLDYDYIITTDISNCYGSIYTHSIPWALHGKEYSKQHKQEDNIGNFIDNNIQNMHRGQTNGIPQGSILMDFIAEMVLSYIDVKLIDSLNEKDNISDYKILRYRDDYRIFVKSLNDGELIIKHLEQTMVPFGLKLNSQKTKISDNVITKSIKEDKLAWIFRKHASVNLQKQLLIIHNHAQEYPNSGSLVRALQNLYKSKFTNQRNQLPLISIVVDIAYHNPKTYPICVAILSRLLENLPEQEVINTVRKILNKLKRISHTGSFEIWLQRITYYASITLQYEEPLCQIVSGKKSFQELWEFNWIDNKALRNIFEKTPIIDINLLETIQPTISQKEVELFCNSYSYWG